MLRDRRSHDLDDHFWIDDQICVLQIYGPDLLLLTRRSRSLHNSGLREFKVSNPTSFLCQSPRVDDLWTPVQLPDQWSYFPFRCLTVQHDQWSNDPLLDPTLEIYSGSSDFWSFKSQNFAFLPFFYPKVVIPLTRVLLIQRPRISLGLLPELTDARHVSFRSHGLDLTSGLQAFALRHFQFSNWKLSFFFSRSS
jgi:hypothetical protein